VEKSNVYCPRCDYSWYSREYAEKKKMPKRCHNCYQPGVVSKVYYEKKLEEQKKQAKKREADLSLGAEEFDKTKYQKFMEKYGFLVDFVLLIISLLIIFVVSVYFLYGPSYIGLT